MTLEHFKNIFSKKSIVLKKFNIREILESIRKKLVGIL